MPHHLRLSSVIGSLVLTFFFLPLLFANIGQIGVLTAIYQQNLQAVDHLFMRTVYLERSNPAASQPLQLDEAQSWFDWAQKMGHENGISYGRQLALTGETKQAFEQYKVLIDTSHYPLIAEEYALLAWRVGDVTTAYEQWSQTGGYTPTWAGDILFEQQDLAAAAIEYERAISVNPTNIQANIQLCRIASSYDDLDAAIGYCFAATKSAPQDWTAQLYLAETLAAAGRLDEGLAAAQTSVALYENAYSMRSLALIRLELGEVDEALRILEQSLAYDETATTYLWIGRIYQLNGQLADARTAWERAAELEPQNSLVQQALEGND